MSVHISDSAIYRNSWSSPRLRELFDDSALTRGWIEVIAVLAETESEFGLIPVRAAQQITQACHGIYPDNAFFNEVRENFEETNHSLLGLIRALQRRCSGDSGEWLCYGATVQDITDTQMARILVRVRDHFGCLLETIARTLGNLALRYRHTPMCGRTHGQPGLPITFGFKAAGWLDEIQRHRDRLDKVGTRIAVGQLAGGVGSLSSFGSEALEVQRRFFEKLGLIAPAISWTASRDRIADWLNLLAMISATADRIGHEIYNLQRPEIAEVREGFIAGTVGSITMPQKRNPEISEHLGTLSRMVRYHAAHMNENLVHDHERDGRSWKGEWAIVPAACLATGKALELLNELLQHIEVNTERMLHNLLATQGAVQAESVMLALAPALGKQSAHELIHGLAMEAFERQVPLQEILFSDPRISELLDRQDLDRIFDSKRWTGKCAEMVERVLADSGLFASGLGRTDSHGPDHPDPDPIAAPCAQSGVSASR